MKQFFFSSVPFVLFIKHNSSVSVSRDRLYADIKELTSIKPPRNYMNISSLNQSAQYILEQFRKMECAIDIQRYSVKGNEYKNIICSFGPRNAERIVVGAHYDVYYYQPGADDNASGVAGLLEIGRLLHELRPPLTHRLDLAAYTLEEPPFFRTRSMGSSVHARSLSERGVKVKLMISLEMIGYFSDEPRSQDYPFFFFRWFYPERANFIVVVGKLGQKEIVNKIKKNMIEGSNIDVQSINAPSLLPGIDFSDHFNFWKEGYRAVMITDTAFYRSPHYHTESDTIETLDFDRMAEVVKGVYWTITHL
jgi:Zn-dependent M28 family amino/carboxypeptidase